MPLATAPPIVIANPNPPPRRHILDEVDACDVNETLPLGPFLLPGGDGVPSTKHPASTVRTTINITKCFIGAASFELPSAILAAGLWGGFVGILVLAILSYYTLRILARCGHLTAKHNPTYPEIGKAAFGRYGWCVAWFGVLCMTLGVCGSYLVFVANALQSLLGSHVAFFAEEWRCVLIVIPGLIVLSWFRSYTFLAPFSFFGILALMFSLIVTMIDAFTNHDMNTIDHYPAVKWATMPQFVGNAAFLYLIHSVILPTEQNMKYRSGYPNALGVSVVFVTILNLCFATLAYLLYSENTQGNVIQNLRDGTLKTVVYILLCIDLYFTYALFLFPFSEIVESEIIRRGHMARGKDGIRNGIRAILVGITAAIAYAVPKFNVLTGLSGGFGNNLVGFILPPIFFLRLMWLHGHWETMTFSKYVEFGLNVAIACFGGVIMVLATYEFATQI